MASLVRYAISKVLSPLWRRVEDEEVELFYAGADPVHEVRSGVVTHLYADYGLIDQTVCFTPAVVLGGAVLRVGDSVRVMALRDAPHTQWKALRVERLREVWEDGALDHLTNSADKPRPLIGTVTSCNQEGGFINHSTFFPSSALCEGFQPVKGDWVLAHYVLCSAEMSSQAQSVSPLRYRRMDGVRVNYVFGGNGVVDDSVYFLLDSLIMPPGFRPTRGDLVNIVVVESSQSMFCWRALCMTPVQRSAEAAVPAVEISVLLENKGGLEVSTETNFGSLLLGSGKDLQIWIRNCGDDTHRLMRCEFAGWDSAQQFCLGSKSSEETQDPDHEKKLGENVKDDEGLMEISPGKNVSVKVICQAKTLGAAAELLLLHFSSFTIGRRLEVSVNSVEELLLRPSAPYCPLAPVPPPQPRATQVLTFTAAPAPVRLLRRHLPNFLKTYYVPQALRDCVESQGDVVAVEPVLAEPLTLASMSARFSALLWLEELQAEREMREFSITAAVLQKGASYLHLEVPGLEEGRLSLNIGDKVLLKKVCSDGLLEYISYASEISEDQVSLRVNADLQNNYLGEPLDVEFCFNRVPIRRCHSVLEQITHFTNNILFPIMLQLQPPQWSGAWDPQEEGRGLVEEVPNSTAVEEASTLTADTASVATQTNSDLALTLKRVPPPGQFFNPKLNAAQKEAVKHILSGEARPTPYVLFGPPGTGKTITLIEAVLQIHHRVSDSRILVCTPSNSAADLVCARLHDSGFLHDASMARVNATSRPEEAMPQPLRKYARFGENIRQASFHRIVVSTCSSAGMFYQIGLRVGHFTHVFVDEAGQATEPETLIPLGLLSETTGQMVLCGDPKQLGPVVKSKLASAFGLGVSFLERLMGTELYGSGASGYDPLLVTKLVYNYRSHEALLELPSRLFYGGELCVRSERAVVDSFCHWSQLPTKSFPFIFHGIRGEEMRECNNPSWFNPVEAVQVMLYCCQLTKRLYQPVSTSDIGVITPYKKQVEKIRLLLQRAGLAEIKVGSVEEFQGQEFLVVLLSTVRSNEALVEAEPQSLLGFLSNPKRFNVAITRAKALLVVLGNPHVLIRDMCFRALLQYCCENRAFVGCDPPPSLLPSRTSPSPAGI